MALVAGAWFISLSQLDSGNDVTSKTYRLQAATAADAATAAAAFVTAYKLTTDAHIVEYAVSQKYIENALTGFSDDTVRNSMTASMSASILDQPLKKATIVVQAPKNAMFTAITGEGSDIVDTSPGSVAMTFLEEFWDGGNVFCSDGETLDAILNAKGVRVSRYRRLAK